MMKSVGYAVAAMALLACASPVSAQNSNAGAGVGASTTTNGNTGSVNTNGTVNGTELDGCCKRQRERDGHSDDRAP